MLRPSIVVALAVGLIWSTHGLARASQRSSELVEPPAAEVRALRPRAFALDPTDPLTGRPQVTAASTPTTGGAAPGSSIAQSPSLRSSQQPSRPIYAAARTEGELHFWLSTDVGWAPPVGVGAAPGAAGKSPDKSTAQLAARSATNVAGKAAAAGTGQGMKLPAAHPVQPAPVPAWTALVPSYLDASPLPAQGRAMYYNPGVMAEVLAYRLDLGHVTPCAECIGYVALLRRGDLNRRVWIQWPGGEVDGPYLVVDVAARQHVGTLLARDWVVDVDHETAARRTMNQPLPVTVLAGP